MKHQHGLALPMVMLLSCLCSLLVLAEWRSLTMAQALGRSAALRWHMKQDAFNALHMVVNDIQRTASDDRHQMGTVNATHAFFPSTLHEWQTLQSRLLWQACQTGICRPLGADNDQLTPWLSRMAQAQELPEQRSVYWVEILPLAAVTQGDWPFLYRITVLNRTAEEGPVYAVQALWQPPPNTRVMQASAVRLNDFIRLLPLTP
jgi:hypothetical protein